MFLPGDSDVMISLQEFEIAYLVHHVGDLIFPRLLAPLKAFRDTLDLLYSYKHHYLNMKVMMDIAQHRHVANQNLCRYRSSEQLKPAEVKKQKTSHLRTTSEENDDNLFD